MVNQRVCLALPLSTSGSGARCAGRFKVVRPVHQVLLLQGQIIVKISSLVPHGRTNASYMLNTCKSNVVFGEQWSESLFLSPFLEREGNSLRGQSILRNPINIDNLPERACFIKKKIF